MSRVKRKLQTRKREAIYCRFGKAVAKQRTLLGMTQRQLAVKVHKADSTIAGVENGFQRIYLKDLFDFAKALEVDAIALINWMRDE